MQPFYRGASTQRTAQDAETAPLKGKYASFVREAFLLIRVSRFGGRAGERRGEASRAEARLWPEGQREAAGGTAQTEGGRSRRVSEPPQPGAATLRVGVESASLAPNPSWERASHRGGFVINVGF